MDPVQLLGNTLSTDSVTREQATASLNALEQENFPGFALAMCQTLANEQIDDSIRMSAGLMLKNGVSSKEEARREEQARRWLSMVDENTRNQVKQGLLMTLATQRKLVGNTAAQAIAAIAQIELPVQQWPDLIRAVLANVTTTDNAVLKQSTLQAIGYICEGTDPRVLAAQSNEILTAVVQGARKEEPDQGVRLAAIKALNNSLEFVKENFERDGERNFIMQVVCEATQSESSDVQIAAFECLVRIMQLYYDKMRYYMEKALFGLTVNGMNNPEEKVALQAIEFWSTVCDEEMELKLDIADAVEAGENPERNLYNFAETAMADILPVLLWLLTKQEEDQEDDEWNVSMAAATCLSLFAQCVGNPIIPPVVPFVETNIQNADWRYREAAVMAFGSILDGPDGQVLAPLVHQALPTLINMMKDPYVNVKDTVAWTLGRVCELLFQCIEPETHLHNLITSLVYGLQDNPRIVGNCCWSLMNLAERLGPAVGEEAPTSPLSPYSDGMIEALMQFTDRSDNEANCRTSAYEAISSIILYSANDCIPLVQKVALNILDRLDATIAMGNQIVSSDDRAEHSELQSNILGVLTSSIRRLSHDIASVADRIMAGLLQLLNNSTRQATTTEDAFLAVGAMCTALEGDFARYAEPFAPILCNALQNPAEYQLCYIAVGLIGDMCRALGENVLPYCNTFMQLLVNSLQSPLVHRSVKPVILSCFGDIALAIGTKFEPYVEVVMMVLQQASGLRADKDNYEYIEYINTITESTVEAYVGMVQGMAGTDKSQVLFPYMDGIFQYLAVLAMDVLHRSESLTRAMVGLLGDLADTYGSQIKAQLSQPWILQLLREARTSRHYGSSTKETARWTKEMVKRATQ
ncbi:armadillo-type protein [Syncephalastrum racemosum]|uniref:Importin-95 n=1 Tax=Syncephalastrum racemosum TaxID=13706 RepID=A0A1X2HEM9_SYNRA|nr:armadillo-type protein [Syncephalastrum racemosum]